MAILCSAPAHAVPGLLASILGEVAVVDGLAAVQRALAERPDETLVVLGSDVDVDEALEFAAQQRWERPALGVILLRDRLDVVLLSQALRAGVREVVLARDLDGLAEACRRSQGLSDRIHGQQPDPAAAGGLVATVFSTKGGCGKTTVATNLAVALHADGARRVCLIDLDLAFGDVAISLRLNPLRTVADAVAMTGRMDSTGVASLLTAWRPGLDCVLAPVVPGDAEKVPAAVVAELLSVLRGMFDYVIVDTPAQFSEHVLAALDASQVHVLLTTPDVPALKNLRLMLDMLDLLSYDPAGRAIVVNRADSRVGLTVDDVERVVKAPIAARVPSSRAVPASTNRGVPIMADQPSHPVSVALRRFAERTVLPANEPTQGPARRGGMVLNRSRRLG
jgi:pilus assembly protein CpaE